jgi:hypothetical protein
MMRHRKSGEAWAHSRGHGMGRRMGKGAWGWGRGHGDGEGGMGMGKGIFSHAPWDGIVLMSPLMALMGPLWASTGLL